MSYNLPNSFKYLGTLEVWDLDLQNSCSFHISSQLRRYEWMFEGMVFESMLFFLFWKFHVQIPSMVVYGGVPFHILKQIHSPAWM